MLVFVLVLTGCASVRLGGNGGGGRLSTPATTRTVIDVAGQDIVIQGPPGFCVDKSVSQTGGDTVFVLLGSCRAVSPSTRAPEPAVKALLTASVSGTGQGALVRDSTVSMDKFFRSVTGRTALSRESDPATVKVLETFQNDDLFFLRARDSSAGIVPGAADDYWRAYFDLAGQIVSVSVIGFTETPLAPEKGLDTLRDFADLIRQSNGIGTAPATVVTRQPAAEETTATRVPKRRTDGNFWSVGLLRRILN
jgi:hypothetical protein